LETIPLTSWNDYKGSPEWYALKDRALMRAGYRCEHEECVYEGPVRCTNHENLEMHHITYPDHPIQDSLNNVMILCRDCHDEMHACPRCGSRLSQEEIEADFPFGICFDCFVNDHN